MLIWVIDLRLSLVEWDAKIFGSWSWCRNLTGLHIGQGVILNKIFYGWSSHSVRKHIVFSAHVCLKKCYLIQGRFSVNHKIILRLVMWTLYTLTSVCIFSTQFFIHLLRCLQGKFVSQSNGFFPADHFLNSHDLNVWFRSDIVGRNTWHS